MGLPLFYAKKSEGADNNLRRPKSDKHICIGSDITTLEISPLASLGRNDNQTVNRKEADGQVKRGYWPE